MTARKTITIAALKSQANDLLATSADDAREGRTAISVLIEHVLMDTGNYHGFRYLPGVLTAGHAMSGDETRRAYY